MHVEGYGVCVCVLVVLESVGWKIAKADWMLVITIPLLRDTEIDTSICDAWGG